MNGLYHKYTIVNNETGLPIEDAFVLKPQSDKEARSALRVYASLVRIHNPTLAQDLDTWLDNINAAEGQ